jgi:hypothetical protein
VETLPAISPQNNIPSLNSLHREISRITNLDDLKDFHVEFESELARLEKYAKSLGDTSRLVEIAKARTWMRREFGGVIIRLKRLGALARRGRPRKTSDESTLSKTLKHLGISRNNSSVWQNWWRMPDGEFQKKVVEPVISKILYADKSGEREHRRREKQETLYGGNGIRVDSHIHVGDFRELSPQIIRPNSVPLVMTDPLYNMESLQSILDLEKESARILVDGGSLVFYVGHVILPDVIKMMGTHLQYFMTLATVFETGRYAILRKHGVVCKHLPMLWYVKGHRGDPQKLIDSAVVSRKAEKKWHPYGKAQSDAEYFIKHLTGKGGTVVDFFCGGGTTLVAAEKLGRKWVGFEIDRKVARRASQRIEEFRNSR